MVKRLAQLARALNTRTPGSQRTRPGVQSTDLPLVALAGSYADFFRSAGNERTFPRCSSGIHFTFDLNLAGM